MDWFNYVQATGRRYRCPERADEEPVVKSELTSGERQLWSAVLMQALKDYAGAGDRGEVERWLASNWYAPGSFRWVCDVLGMNPGGVRVALRGVDGVRRLRGALGTVEAKRYRIFTTKGAKGVRV